MTTLVSDKPARSEHPHAKTITIVMVAIAVVFTLVAYQYEHHGLWGKLVNYNKSPALILQGTKINGGVLTLAIYRPNGPDTYGSFPTQVEVLTHGGADVVESWGPSELAALPKSAIKNHYPIQKIAVGPFGLVVPLSAKGKVTMPLSAAATKALAGASQVGILVKDVSGLAWKTKLSCADGSCKPATKTQNILPAGQS